MKNSLTAVGITLLLQTAALAAEPAAGPAVAPQVGAAAPSFKLKDETGKEHSLSSYKGKIVVLEWTNPECPFVKRHYESHTMEKTRTALDASKVVWLAVDSTAHNTPERSAAWKKAEKFTNPVLQDPSGQVGRQFAAKTTPHMFVVDAQGILRYAGAIDDDPRGNNATPVNLVKQAVEALLAGKPVPTPTTSSYGCSVKYKST